MGQANDSPHQSRANTPLWGEEVRPPSPLRDFRGPVRGLSKVQDRPLGAGGLPGLRPDHAPGNAQLLNGMLLPGQIAQGHS